MSSSRCALSDAHALLHETNGDVPPSVVVAKPTRPHSLERKRQRLSEQKKRLQHCIAQLNDVNPQHVITKQRLQKKLDWLCRYEDGLRSPTAHTALSPEATTAWPPSPSPASCGTARSFHVEELVERAERLRTAMIVSPTVTAKFEVLLKQKTLLDATFLRLERSLSAINRLKDHESEVLRIRHDVGRLFEASETEGRNFDLDVDELRLKAMLLEDTLESARHRLTECAFCTAHVAGTRRNLSWTVWLCGLVYAGTLWLLFLISVARDVCRSLLHRQRSQ